MGLAFLPTVLIERDLAEGRLRRVLPDYQPFQAQLYAIYPSRKYLSAKVRLFIDFLVAEFGIDAVGNTD